LLVVAPRDQVEPYTRVADLAGIRLAALDLEALGLLRAFVAPGTGARTPDDTASVVVSIGHESSTLLVAGGGACEFTRVFDWGGSALEEAVASSLDVRPAEAAMILRHLSLSGPGRQYETLDEVRRAQATDAVRQRLTPFARELVNSLQFYQTQAESLGIGGIQITGGTSHLEGIDDALHQMIGVNVAVGDPLSRVIRAADFDPALESAIGSLAVPIGLAIDDMSMRGVNLLPKGTVSKKSRRSTLVAIGAPVAVAVPLAALAFLYVGAHGKVVDQQGQLDQAKADLAALPVPATPVIDTAIVGDEAVRATAVANVLGGRLAWEAVFRDMSKVLPANVWLSSLSLTAPEVTNLADGTTPAPAPTAAGVQPVPNAVSIDGFTFTQPDVARLLARLATLPSLKRVTLTSSQSQLVGTKKKVVHFVIVADLNQTGGAS
jgi:Tfp pilus assembly protein PilN